MKFITKSTLINISFLSVPIMAFAAVRDLQDIMDILIDLIEQAIIVVVALALLVFFWGLVKFIMSAGSEEGRKEGKSIMIWGIIALFVMLSVAGILRVLDNTFFGGSGGGGIKPPPSKPPTTIII
jgi:hypothetical protein